MALARIESTLGQVATDIRTIMTEAAADRQKLDSHLLECTARNAVIHKRIDAIKTTQRWWIGQLILAAVGGGSLGEAVRLYVAAAAG